MFNKKCPKCEKSVKKSFDFCPHCQFNLKSTENKADYGLLGKTDIIEEENFLTDNFFLNKLFKSAIREFPNMIKTIEKQIQENMNKKPQNSQNPPKNPKNIKFQFFVNGKQVFPQNQQFQGNNQHTHQPQNIEKPKTKKKSFRKTNLEKSYKLPKKEPSSKIRRLGGKIIYELQVPGVSYQSTRKLN